MQTEFLAVIILVAIVLALVGIDLTYWLKRRYTDQTEPDPTIDARLRSLEVLDLKPNDKLVVIYQQVLSSEDMARVHEEMVHQFQHSNVLVLESGPSIGIIRSTSEYVETPETSS